METTVQWIEHVARLMEFGGVAIILLGTLAASAVFAWKCAARVDFGAAYTAYRRNLGRAILLGLEFLVGADIIGTVAIEPTFRNLGILGLIVLVRTFLSFSLEVEIEGHWPWQRNRVSRSAPPK